MPIIGAGGACNTYVPTYGGLRYLLSHFNNWIWDYTSTLGSLGVVVVNMISTCRCLSECPRYEDVTVGEKVTKVGFKVLN